VIWNILALVLSVSGGALAMWGTLIMASTYHANGAMGYVMSLFHVIGVLLKDGRAGVRTYWRTQAVMGVVNVEDRAKALNGLALIFAGFLLQVLGNVCAYVATLAN
jgi:hypothetical protein